MASFNVIIRVVIVSALLTTIALVAGQTNGYCNLVWNDEFTGTELDSTKWNKEITCNGGGNGELQCYTPRPQNIFIRNGSLVLKVLRETYTGTQQGCTDNQGCTNTKDFTSGRVNSAGKGSFLYGRMEVRAKLVNGRALWPAIWMLPTDYAYGGWAASGEIDIMEMKGEHPNIVSSTLHHGGAWPNNMWTTTGDKDMAVDLSQDWHTYGCEWNASTIVWFVDKRVTDVFNLNRSWYSGKGPNPYTQNGQPWDKRFHFVFNVAVGGNFFGANYPPPSDAEAAAWKVPEMNIDYVRVWQQGGDCTKDPFASTATTSTDENPDEIGEGGSDSTWLSKNAIIVFPAVFGGLLVIGAAILGVALYFKLRRRFEINPGLQTQPSNTQIVTIFPGSP